MLEVSQDVTEVDVKHLAVSFHHNVVIVSVSDAQDVGCNTAIVEILFPKETLRARALEEIIVHKIEVSEGVSIFIEKRKINILLPYTMRMVRYPSKFHLLE